MCAGYVEICMGYEDLLQFQPCHYPVIVGHIPCSMELVEGMLRKYRTRAAEAAPRAGLVSVSVVNCDL